jgi:hypothetical protein
MFTMSFKRPFTVLFTRLSSGTSLRYRKHTPYDATAAAGQVVPDLTAAEHLQRGCQEAGGAVRVRAGPSPWQQAEVALCVMPSSRVPCQQPTEVID